MTDNPNTDRSQPQPRSPQAVNYLFVALCPLIFWMLRGDMGSLVAGIILLGIYGYAAHLIVAALEDEEVGIVLTGRIPRKLVGSAMIGLASFLLALIQMGTFTMALAMGALALGLSVVAFGIDARVTMKTPVRKGSPKEVRKLIGAAERVLAAIPERLAEIDDEASFLQAQAFRHTMLDMMAKYPDALEDTTAELHHVLNEAAEATDLFVEDFGEDPDPRFRRRYMQLLRELAEALEGCLIELSQPDELPEYAEEDAIFSGYDQRHVA